MKYLSIFAAVVFSAATASAQTPATVGTAGAADPAQLLWKDPGDVASRDLFWGIGSQDRAPGALLGRRKLSSGPRLLCPAASPQLQPHHDPGDRKHCGDDPPDEDD